VNDFGERQLGSAVATFLFLGLLGICEPGGAGTGRLLSSWMSRAPAIDGLIGATEWNEAAPIDLGAGVSVRIGNDGRTLYLAILDSGDLTQNVGDAFHLYFDDEGGVAPVLDDGAYGAPACQQAPDLGEGVIGADFQQILFSEFSQAGQCPAQTLAGRTSFATVAQPAGLTYEAAIPLDGPAPLRAGPGDRFGIYLRLFRDGAAVACLPGCGVLDPPEYRNLVLASGGCNTGPQRFGGGPPQTGLPLDWTSELTLGSGDGWGQSAIDGDQFYCGMNVTGGTGAAACVTNVHYTSAEAESLLHLPLPVAAQTWATVRLLGNFQLGASGDLLAFGSRYEFIPFFSMLLWQTSHGDPGGPGTPVTLELSLFTGNYPRELIFWHYTASAGGTEGGFAQVDDVELLCGPILFADGFESGLVTHWSASAP
jgi:hypothetical protein